jgi:hypothetical protein
MVISCVLSVALGKFAVTERPPRDSSGVLLRVQSALNVGGPPEFIREIIA